MKQLFLSKSRTTKSLTALLKLNEFRGINYFTVNLNLVTPQVETTKLIPAYRKVLSHITYNPERIRC